MYLLELNKNPNILSFYNEINSHEFVEIIGDMDLSFSIDYKKRDLYLKELGQINSNRFKLRKIKNSKIRIKINHDIVYLSEKARENKVKLFFKKLFKLNIVININIIKFENYFNSIEYYNEFYKKTEVLSQEEIDMLLTAITPKSDDKDKINHELRNEAKLYGKQ
ncbi:hypothetical protein R84B8_01654 [Treponema sp. R8-4-B8]